MAFATGIYSYGLCDYCGQRYKYNNLRKNWRGFMVCPDDYEPKEPQRLSSIEVLDRVHPHQRGRCKVERREETPERFADDLRAFAGPIVGACEREAGEHEHHARSERVQRDRHEAAARHAIRKAPERGHEQQGHEQRDAIQPRHLLDAASDPELVADRPQQERARQRRAEHRRGPERSARF
jgi:hypothetical protein